MKIFGSDTEYFVGERSDMGMEEAQRRASTQDEDQDEDPEVSQGEIDAIYAATGMDPNMWEPE